MTNEEAKKHINAFVISECENIPYQVIQALDVFREANNKQIPMKPDVSKVKIRYVETYMCPVCGRSFSGRIAKYCYNCGQAIDWSEV